MTKKYLNPLLGCVLWLLSTLAVASDAPDDVVGPFAIARFSVSGDTLLGAAPIDQLLSSFLGKQRRFSDVQLAVNALQEAYRNRGFTLVRVQLPEQELNLGVIHLVVIQTPISRVQVSGNLRYTEANIRRTVPGLQEGQTPNLKQISDSLALANESPARKTSLALQSDNDSGSVIASLQVIEEKTWAAGLAVDNAGGDKTGKTQLTAQYQNFDFAGLDHTLSLQFTTTAEQPSNVNVYGFGYRIPLHAWGDSLDFYGSYSNVDSGTVTTGNFNVQVSGKGTTWGGRYNHRLARVGNLTSKLIFGLEYKALQNNLGFQGVQLGNDVTVHPLSVGYLGEWAQPGASTSVSLTALRNLPGGDRGGQSDFTRLRSGASSSYSLLRYGLAHSRSLPSDWQLRAALNGQLTRDALVPGEQFGAGGAASVRGFTERAVSDDQGMMANLELYTPEFCSSSGGYAAQCRVLAFYDAARVSRNQPFPGERTDAGMASAGLGLRLAMGKLFSLQMDVGRVIRSSDSIAPDKTRMHLKMNLAY